MRLKPQVVLQKTLRETLAIVLAVALAFIATVGFMPTKAFATLHDEESATIKLFLGEGSYTADPVGFTKVDSHNYTIELEENVYRPVKLTLPAAPDNVPSNRHFVSWVDGANRTWNPGDVVTISDLTELSVANNAENPYVITALWEYDPGITVYNVNFYDGNTLLKALNTAYLPGAASITLPAVPTKAGYAANGWIRQDDESRTLNPAGAYSVSGLAKNLTFVASYALEKHTITLLVGSADQSAIATLVQVGFTYDDSCEVATMANVTLESSVTIPSITNKHGHEVFLGWCKYPMPANPVYSQTVTLSPGDITSDLTYAAVVRAARTLTINLNLNGGSFTTSDSAELANYGYNPGVNDQFTVYECDYDDAPPYVPLPRRVDYVFDAWLEDGEAEKESYTVADSIYLLPGAGNQTINLTAHWSQAPHGTTTAQVEGNAAGRLDDSSVDQIEHILSYSIASDETSIVKIVVGEDITNQHAGTEINSRLENAFSGALGKLAKTFIDLDLTNYVSSATKNNEAVVISDFGRVADIIFQPTNGVANLRTVIREHKTATGKTYTQFKKCDTMPTDPKDGTYYVDLANNKLHIFTRFLSTFALGSANSVYEVKFDTAGGKESYDPIYTDKLGILPTPTWNDTWSFDYWAYADGSKAQAGDTLTSDITLKAKWKSSDQDPVEPEPERELVLGKDGATYYKNDDGKNTVTLLDGGALKGKITINTVKDKKSKKTYKVTRIDANALHGTATITKLTIGSNVKSIGDYAFANLNKLTSATIGNNVVSIGAYAFEGCTKLTSVTIGQKVRSIGAYAFNGDKKLATINIKTKKLTKTSAFGENCFSRTKSKVVFKIPQKVFKSTKSAIKNSPSGVSKKAKYKKI